MLSERPPIGATRIARRPGTPDAGPPDAPPTPYDRPVIKEPVWTWEVPAYFYAGGLAGAAAGASRLAEAAGNGTLARRASAVAFGGALVSPALLISDLGRPERFMHMLRMLKVTSPMSVGSWILAAFGGSATVGAVDHLLRGRLPGGRAARTAAAALGLPLSSYTAALVANTAIPAWHEARLMLPFVFVSGAAASAGGALTALTPIAHAAPARRLAIVGVVAEIATKERMERGLGELSDAYRSGSAHKLGLAARGSLVAGGAIIAARGRASRRAAVTGGALVNVGALLARWSVYKAGFQSAANPAHVIDPQRRRIRSGASPGAATTGPA